MTTNNQMELQAVIEGLKLLTRKSRVEVVTDSTYVAKGSKEWLPGWKRNGWKRNGWKRKDGSKLVPIKNEEHWKQLDALLSKHQITFKLVPGHAGHPENERCDVLAVAAAEQARYSST